MALFNNPDMFTSAEMTDAINKLPGTVFRFGGMFEAVGSRTTKIDIEVLNGRLTWVNDSPRGSVPDMLGERQPARSVKTISTTHLAQMDVLAPEDIQDVRAFGSIELVTAATVVNDKLINLKRNLDMTLEYHRLGAIKGVVMDPDGRVLHDIFNTFDVTKKTQTVSFPASSPKNSNPILSAIIEAKRKVEDAMRGNPYMRLEAIIGSDFYDMLTGHELVRDAIIFGRPIFPVLATTITAGVALPMAESLSMKLARLLAAKLWCLPPRAICIR